MSAGDAARPAVVVVHNAAAQRFEAQVDGLLCEASYTLAGGVLNATHTEVPSALAGRGIAAQLVAALLAWARSEGLRVNPACSYVAAYMQRHPEVADLRA